MKPHLNYLELLNLWSKIINPHKFDVIPYDINNLMSKDIVSDFLYKTNIKINYNFNNSYIIKHQSLDRRLIEIKKIINKKKINQKIMNLLSIIYFQNSMIILILLKNIKLVSILKIK